MVMICEDEFTTEVYLATLEIRGVAMQGHFLHACVYLAYNIIDFREGS